MNPHPCIVLRRLATLLLILSLFLSGCAALFHGPNQLLPVGSNPPGVDVYVDGAWAGTTPLDLELSRAASHTLLLRRGEQEREVIITQTLDGVMVALDALPGSILLTLTLLLQIPPDCTTFCMDLRGEATPYMVGATIILGGPPIAVDAVTGAWYNLSPADVFIDFEQPADAN